MQPPPRKVKPSVSLKNIQADQVSKLNIKHQQECDLLEDMRSFFSRKAALEKEYAQGMLKMTSQLLKREFPAEPDLNCEDGQEHKTVCAVWRTILEESDRLAKARLQAAEVYSEKVAEPLKPAKAAKVQCFKKVMPQLTVVHAEVAQCVMDLVKTQKAYTTEGGLAHEARQKSSEAEDKLKRKSTGIFQSLASLQKVCAKLRARTEASEVKETTTRNEYLLSLAAANAHQIRYYSTDLPDLMKTLDCDVYEKIQESLTLAGQVALEIADNEASFFHNIAVEAAKICREFSQQCYLFQNPVFTNLVQYQFEPCAGDTCNKLSSDHNAGPELEKEARKWSTRVAKETRAIRDYYRQMTVVQNLKAGDKTSESSGQDTADPEAKLEELKQSIRKAEVTKLKAEARLEALRLGGVNVDEWINQAQMESLVAEESGLTRTPSQASLRTESSGGQSANDDHEPTYTHYDEDDDFIDDTFSGPSSRSGRVYPIFCKALYDFQASNYDEMTIKMGDDLELVADGDGDGWVKAKNSLGQEGYIPETYVDLSGQSNMPAPLGVEAMNAINEKFSENIAPATPPAAPSQQRQSVARTTTPDLQSPTSGDLQQDTTSSYSSGDLEIQQTTEVMATGRPAVPPTVVTSAEAIWARALYDYEAQTDEELSFLEGALIRIMRKDDGGVDDGFWEGECNGRTGMFPSLVVEELSGPPDDPLSPGLTQPDFSVPPPVHVTLPTPENEPPPLANGEDSQSTPTPTADQASKRVRFEQQASVLQQQHTHPHRHTNQHRQHHVLSRQQGSANEVTRHTNRQLGHLQTSAQTPILRHKSLPSSLNLQESETLNLQQQPCDHTCHSSLSPHPHIKHQQSVSRSQPQLSPTSVKSPPPCRKLDLQQQKNQLQEFQEHQQLQRYPSEPLSINSEEDICQNLHWSLPETITCGRHCGSHSHSYPSSPQMSPQTEMPISVFEPQISDLSATESQRKPLLHFQLYQQTCPDICQGHQHTLSSMGTPHRSLTSHAHRNLSFVQSLTGSPPNVTPTYHHRPHPNHPPPPYSALPQISHNPQQLLYPYQPQQHHHQQQFQPYQPQQQHQQLPLHNHRHSTSGKLSVFSRVRDEDDWGSDEGEESLV